MKSWTISRRITALSAAVGVLLALIAISTTLTAAANRDQVNRLADRISPAWSNSEALLGAVLRQESGLRSYAATSRLEDLNQYNEGVRSQQAVEAATAGFLRDENRLLARLTEIQDLTRSWRAQVAEPLLSRVRTEGPNMAWATPDDDSRARLAHILDRIAAFQQMMAETRAEARRTARSSDNLLALLLISAAVVVVAAGFALAALLRQLVTRPVVQLASEVRRVAEGEYDLDIRAEGPPEVVRLADDVDAMRRQIVADLATVRRARVLLEEANLRLEQQAGDLSRSNRDLEQFAYVASHDLQEPLRKVASFCQLLQRRYAGHLDERADQYIAFAVDGAQRMQRLINDLLAFSRIGRITTGFTEVDLNVVLEEVSSQLEARRAYVNGEISWSDLPTVRGEEHLLSALFANLISNSLKFRRTDVPPRVEISADQIGDEWQLSCRDNGIGIEAEFADKIFVIFQRLHPRDQYPGTGIGLAVVKKIVEYHGGRIWLDTHAGEGTLIRFTLPVVPAESRPERDVAPAAALGADGSESDLAGVAPTTATSSDESGLILTRATAAESASREDPPQ